MRNLDILRQEDSHIVCELINRQFFYKPQDWFNGKVEYYNILSV